MRVIGLESSCDETSIALLKDTVVEANEIYTQKIHSLYGGVVPEVAARAHIQKIDRLCATVLDICGVTPDGIDLIAVTDSPGLAGALLVGISFGLGLHTGWGIPITGINHLEGHIASVLLEHQDLTYPFIALVASGGHTALYTVDDFTVYTCLGQTIDDAAGEAFDKIGKLLGFPYPAGRAIEQKASEHTDPDNVIRFPIARVAKAGINFSFSGLKTAVKYFLEHQSPSYIEEHLPLICFSFQKAIVDALVNNCMLAVESTGIRKVALVGGVACNISLRKRLGEQCNGAVFFPSPSLCTDNGAMIAKAGLERFNRRKIRFPRMDPAAAL